MSSFGEHHKLVNALSPVADAYAADPGGDVVSMENWNRFVAIIHEGVGTTGTVTVTVEACDDFTPSNVTAIAFRYKAVTSGDTEGAYTTAAAAGFGTTAGSAHMYMIEIVSSELPAGKPNVRLKLDELVDDPVLAGVTYILSEPRYASDSHATTIA